MSERSPLVRWIRRPFMGGRLSIRVFRNGNARITVDHPSNDPEVEFAMAGRAIAHARRVYAEHGMTANVGPVTWRDDP